MNDMHELYTTPPGKTVAYTNTVQVNAGQSIELPGPEEEYEILAVVSGDGFINRDGLDVAISKGTKTQLLPTEKLSLRARKSPLIAVILGIKSLPEEG
jgi:hypothetical protein